MSARRVGEGADRVVVGLGSDQCVEDLEGGGVLAVALPALSELERRREPAARVHTSCGQPLGEVDVARFASCGGRRDEALGGDRPASLQPPDREAQAVFAATSTGAFEQIGERAVQGPCLQRRRLAPQDLAVQRVGEADVQAAPARGRRR